jgi:general secretion pathway protein C
MLKARLYGRATRLLLGVAWLVALVVAATVAAALLSRLMAPQRTGATGAGTADPHQAARQIVARSPLASSATAEESTPQPLRSAQHHTVLGIATGFGASPGFALVQTSGGAPVPARIGDEIAPGVVVKTIHATHIEIERNGVRETLTMVLPSTATPASTTPAPPDTANQR